MISAKGTHFLKSRPSELPLKSELIDTPLIHLIQETEINSKQKQVFKIYHEYLSDCCLLGVEINFVTKFFKVIRKLTQTCDSFLFLIE